MWRWVVPPSSLGEGEWNWIELNWIELMRNKQYSSLALMWDQQIKEKRNEESTWRRDKSRRHERSKFDCHHKFGNQEWRKEGRSEGVVACVYSNCGMATAPSICVHALWRCKLQLHYRFLPSFLLSLSLSLSLSSSSSSSSLYSHGSCTLAYHLPSSCIISFLPFHFFGKHSKKFLSVFLSLNLEGTIYSWISLLRKKTVLVPTPWE